MWGIFFSFCNSASKKIISPERLLRRVRQTGEDRSLINERRSAARTRVSAGRFSGLTSRWDGAIHFNQRSRAPTMYSRTRVVQRKKENSCFLLRRKRVFPPVGNITPSADMLPTGAGTIHCAFFALLQGVTRGPIEVLNSVQC